MPAKSISSPDEALTRLLSRQFNRDEPHDPGVGRPLLSSKDLERHDLSDLPDSGLYDLAQQHLRAFHGIETGRQGKFLLRLMEWSTVIAPVAAAAVIEAPVVEARIVDWPTLYPSHYDYGSWQTLPTRFNAYYGGNPSVYQFTNFPRVTDFSAQTSAENLEADPIGTVVKAFEAIPKEYRDDFFTDFSAAAQSRDMGQFLRTFADWAATGEVYAIPGMAEEVLSARDSLSEETDWEVGT